MSLPSPNLDDRSFQEMVDHAKRQIALRCPEWTEHNVSDPGVTLIELFAQMAEMIQFRLNQVPEKNYQRFLEMVGIQLRPRDAAEADLRFDLVRPLVDSDSEEDDGAIRIRPFVTTIGSFRRTEEAPVEFEVQEEISFVRPQLQRVVSVPAGALLDDLDVMHDFPLNNPFPEGSAGFDIFGTVPKAGDAVYLCFGGQVQRHVLALEVGCTSGRATGLVERYPLQVWEYWSGETASWQSFGLVDDTTHGFNRHGRVELTIPRDAAARLVAGQVGVWVRARYSMDREELPYDLPDDLRPIPYERSPSVLSVKAMTVAGVARALNATTETFTLLGTSDGLPGQVFSLAESPVLALDPDVVVYVGPVGAPLRDMEEWVPTADFSQSAPSDRHFVFDPLGGTVTFGPNLAQRDGTNRQHGAVPDKGMGIVLSRLRFGGGVGGNVREHQLRVPRQALPYISGVTNPRPATGGRELEAIEAAKIRALEVLKIRERAVTAEDFEVLALRATSAISRCKCIQPSERMTQIYDPARPGRVVVLLVPTLPQEVLVPRWIDLQVPTDAVREVTEFLDTRRLLTATLDVREAEYVFVSVEATVVVDRGYEPLEVQAAVGERLSRFIHPSLGSEDGQGWRFGRTLSMADLYSQILSVEGVASIRRAGIHRSHVENSGTGKLSKEAPVNAREGLRLMETQVLASRSHRIRAVPLSSVGAELESTED